VNDFDQLINSKIKHPYACADLLMTVVM